MKPYRLHELHAVPPVAGIYAWYYELQLSDKDVQRAVAHISAETVTRRREDAVRAFLMNAVFASFIETPYDVEMRGPLKPRYSGQVTNQANISVDLIRRFASEPNRLWALRTFLQSSVPHFASPIYIGVAISLRDRLLRHKSLIDKYREARADLPVLAIIDEADDELRRDHSFAAEVVNQRHFVVPHLVVYTMDMSVEPAVRVDVEHILNRINFPLCGRQ